MSGPDCRADPAVVVHRCLTPRCGRCSAHALMESNHIGKIVLNGVQHEEKLIAGNWKMNGSLAANEAWSGLAGRPGAPGLSGGCVCAFALPGAGAGLLAGQRPSRWARRTCRRTNRVPTPVKFRRPCCATSACATPSSGIQERRQYHGETDACGGAKAQRLGGRHHPIVCVGETLAEREAGVTEDVVKRQLAAVIHANGHCISEIVVAYEPVWAIGTGKTARRSRRRQVHAVLRAVAPGRPHRPPHQDSLYGGSMNAPMPADFAGQPDIDGGLVGGASLKAPDFLPSLPRPQCGGGTMFWSRRRMIVF